MKVGLYFGSFNPIHIGHLIVANHIINETDLQKIWFVVSPQNPFKASSTLLNEYHRFHLVQLAIADNDRFKASDVEFSLPKPSYTAHTLARLTEKYPTYEFFVIMGSDSFQNLPNWKNAGAIIKNYPILIYQRPGYEVVNTMGANITVMKAPLLEISSTYIRDCISRGKSVEYLVLQSVKEEIEKSGFYRKPQSK